MVKEKTKVTSNKKPEVKKFDLIRELQNKIKKDGFIFEGAMVAFRTPNNQTGTITLTEDLGVRLRLIQEAHIQERLMDRQTDEMIRNMYFPPQAPPSKSSTSYLG